MKLTKFTWVRCWLYSPIREDKILRQTGQVTSVEDGTTLASCCLSFLAKQSSSLCSFLCCSLCATPVWIALLQLGCSLASCSHFMCLILHCFRLCLRIPLKHFHCSATLWLRLPLVSLPYWIFFGSTDKGMQTRWPAQWSWFLTIEDSIIVTFASSKTLLFVCLSCHLMLRIPWRQLWWYLSWFLRWRL